MAIHCFTYSTILPLVALHISTKKILPFLPDPSPYFHSVPHLSTHANWLNQSPRKSLLSLFIFSTSYSRAGHPSWLPSSLEFYRASRRLMIEFRHYPHIDHGDAGARGNLVECMLHPCIIQFNWVIDGLIPSCSTGIVPCLPGGSEQN